jgi:hypothetical protein
VPGISRLPARTGELTERTQKLLPPRRRPAPARENSHVKGYPNGYRLSELGTFEESGGCPFTGADHAGADRTAPGHVSPR